MFRAASLAPLRAGALLARAGRPALLRAVPSSAQGALAAARASGVRAMATAPEMTIRDALNSAIDEEMERDPTVFIIGARARRAAPAPRASSSSQFFLFFALPPSAPPLLLSPLRAQARRSASTRARTRSRAACTKSTAATASLTRPSPRRASPASPSARP
jgi:hypothetical protein